MSVAATITHTATVLDVSTGTLANASLPLTQQYTSQLASVTKEYNGQRSTTGETIDLTSTLANPYGVTLNFGTVKYLYIQNTDASKTLTIGGGTSAWSTDQYTIAPGGCISIVTSYAISGSVKNLKVLPSSGTVIYNLIVVGL